MISMLFYDDISPMVFHKYKMDRRSRPGFLFPPMSFYYVLLLRKYIQFTGLHSSFGFAGRHCRTPRTDYPRVCSELHGSRTATVTDQQASFDSGHECCMCGFTDTNVQFFLQGTPGYCSNVASGIRSCWGPHCSINSSAYCVHDIGNGHSTQYNNSFEHDGAIKWKHFYSRY